MQRWSAVSGLVFNQLPDNSSDAHVVDIQIGFSKLHTASSGVIGGTYFRSTNGVFDPDVGVLLEDPTENPLAVVAGNYSYTNYGVTLYQVALHEVGHALGLDHTDDPTSIMHGSVGDANRDLNLGDIAGIQSLYGPHVGPPDVPPLVVMPPLVVPPVVAPPIVLSGTNTLVLHVSEDAYQGDAQFFVTIDGQQVGGVQTATGIRGAGMSQDFTVKGDFGSAAHRVGVQFLNDAWGGTAATDRNLYVDAMDFNGARVANTKATLTNNGTANLAIAATGNTVTFNLSEDAYQGDAQAILRIDGQQFGGVQTITASHGLGRSQAITFVAPAGTGPHSASVEFVNDTWGGTLDTDRNLFVDGIDFNGIKVANTQATLMSNGTATLAIPVANDMITFNLAEDAYQGDAQAILRIDGQQLGGVHTITASHALGQSQALSFIAPAGSGPHTASVQFLNDAWGGSMATDRNLYIGSIDFHGGHYADAAAPLYSNGARSFDIPGVIAPAVAFTIDPGAPHAFVLPV